MRVTVSQVIEDVKLLSAKDESVDAEWERVANRRYKELKSGLVNPISWDEVKKEVRISS